MILCQAECIFIGDGGYQISLFLPQRLVRTNWIAIKKVNSWISTGIQSIKIKLFDTNLESTMSNLANDRIQQL